MSDIYSEYRRKAKMCVRCGNQDARTLTGKYYCFECLKSHNERCNKSEEKHRAENNAMRLERKKNKKAMGICVRCGHRKARQNRVTCGICAAKNRKYAKEKRKMKGVISREEAVYTGLCYLCCKRPAAVGRKQCPECLEKIKKNAEIMRSLRIKSDWGWKGVVW